MDPRAYNIANDEYTDLFSFCSLASEVLTGQWLPRIKDGKTLRDTVENVRPPFPDNIPDRLRRFLLSGFEENVKKRASWEEIIDALCKCNVDTKQSNLFCLVLIITWRTWLITGEAIEEFYPDETDDDSSGFYGSSANNTQSISINKKCTCPEIIAQEDCSFIDSLKAVFNNPANSSRDGHKWLELVEILSLNRTSKKVEEAKECIKNILKDFYLPEYQRELCNQTEKLKVINTIIPLFLANLSHCKKHTMIIQELFQETNNFLIRNLFQKKTEFNFLFDYFLPSSYQKSRKLERKVDFQFVIDLIEDPLQKSTSGYSLVHFASLSGQIEILKSIVEQNPDLINAKNKSLETPIMLAIVGGKVDVINFILTLANKTDINKLNGCGQTAMHYVPLAAKNQVEIFKLLLPYFTDWNMADCQGTTPFMYMTWNGCTDVIEYIWTFSKKPDLNQANLNGYSALHFATFESFSEEANIKGLQFLIEKGANVFREQGKSILLSAVSHGKIQTTKLLLLQFSNNEIKQLVSAVKEQNCPEAIEVMEEARKLL